LACFLQTGACLPKRPPCLTNENCAADERCEVSRARCVPKTCQLDRYEPNNSDTQAFNAAVGLYSKLTLCEGDVDWYALSLARGDRLGVNLDADPFAEDAFSTVIKDSAGRTVSSGRLLLSYVAPSAAKYFVVISSSDVFQPYDVTFLKSRGTPCDDDALEPNDAASQPTQLNVSRQADGVICPQDEDWFRVVVPANKGARAALSHYDSSKGLLKLCAFRSDAVTQLSCSAASTPEVAVAAEVEEHALLIRVSGDTNRIANAYSLSLEFP
jgi:hypothetical protein